MTFWLTAMVVWAAAGARVGRVLVKPATTARVAIVIAVAAVATAVTASIPEMASALDARLPGGLPTGPLSHGVVSAAWLVFAAATSVVAAAAWPVMSRVELRRIAGFCYAVTVLVVAASWVFSSVFAMVATMSGCVFVVVTGVRTLDWTTLGRGIAIYTAGTAAVGLLTAGRWQRHWAGEPATAPGTWPLWQVAALLIALGAVWIVVELWVRARLLLRRIRPLHRTLVERFPEVVAHDRPGTSAQLLASDHVAQIMDALYLQSGSGVEVYAAGHPSASVTERAERVARWARNPLGDVVVDARWVSPPEGVGPRGWVGAIARAFAATSEVAVKSGR